MDGHPLGHDGSNNKGAWSKGGNTENVTNTAQVQIARPEQTDKVSFTDETGTGSKKKRELHKTADEHRQQANPPGSDDMDRRQKNFEDEDLKSLFPAHTVQDELAQKVEIDNKDTDSDDSRKMTSLEINKELDDIHKNCDSLKLGKPSALTVQSCNLSIDSQLNGGTGRKDKKLSSNASSGMDEIIGKMSGLKINTTTVVEKKSSETKNDDSKGILTNPDTYDAGATAMAKNQYGQGYGDQTIPKQSEAVFEKIPELYVKRIPFGKRRTHILCLKLDLEVKKQFPNVTVSLTSEYIEFKGPSEELCEAEKYLDDLFNKIKVNKIQFRKPYITLLSQPEVETYIFEQLERSDIRCYWKINMDENDHIYFFALKDKIMKETEQVFKQHIAIRSGVLSSLASDMLLTFPGKCQKWAASEEETLFSLIYTKDIAEEVESILSAAELKKKAELAELLHKAEIEKTTRESEFMQSEGSEQIEITTADSVAESYTKQTDTGLSQHSYAERSRLSAESSKLTDEQQTDQTNQTNIDDVEESEKADKGSGNEENFAYSFIPMEHCLADFIMLQKDITELQTKLNIKISSNCGKIIVFGDKKEETMEALKQIKALAEASYTDFLLQTNPLMKDSDEWRSIENEAQISNVSIFTRSVEHGFLRDKEHYRAGEVEICVGHGCISDIKSVGMIVVPVNRSFYPITPSSELIFKKGGDDLVEEAKKLITKYVTDNKNAHPPIGHLQISKVAGKLPCNYIAYIVVSENFAEDFYIGKPFFTKLCYILEDLQTKRQTSVALPLELSRTLPVQTSSKIISDAVRQVTVGKTTQLKDICLCAENVDNLKLAKRVFREEFGQLDESEMEIVDIFEDTEDQQNHVNVEVVTGSLVDQKVDAIVCIINEWDLRHGAVAKDILDKGGEKIEQDLQKSTKPGFGDVIAVKAGNLPCSHVIFGSLPCLQQSPKSYVYVLENLKLFTKNCFKTARNSKCHSIAFPVLGTGKMKYPVLMVAREMLRAAHFYAAQNGVDQVKIVLLKDDPNLKVFSELNNRFHTMQKALVEKEDSWKYLDVKIRDCQTVVTVVQGTDQEAFASNIIVKTMLLQQGGNAYTVSREDPNPHVLNTDYFQMYLPPAPTDSGFKTCLEDVLNKLKNAGHVHVTLDFSAGLYGFYNYIELTIGVLKFRSDCLKEVEKLTIVSDEVLFHKLLHQYSDSKTEAANVTFAGKVSGAISSFWSKQAVIVTVKEHKTIPYKGAQTSWLTVLYAKDPAKLQAIRKKIDYYCKKSVGSSVDDKKLSSETKSMKENEEKRKDTARALTSGTRKVLVEDARGSSDLTDTGDSTDLNETGESADLTESGESTQQGGEDSGDEVFGMVEAVLPFDCRPGQQLADLKNSLSGMGTNSVQVGSHGAKTSLTFDFYERHNMQNALLKLKDKGLFSGKEKEFVIEDVDDNLYQLLLLYMKESKGGTQIKMENLSREENKVHVNDEEEIFDVVKSKIQALRSWNTEIVCFDDKNSSKAVNVVQKLKADNLNVIVKLLGNEIHINGASEHTGPAKHKVSIKLGLIKPTGRRRRQFNEEYSSLPLQKSPEPVVTVPAPVVDTGSNSLEKLYQTSEGIKVKVYKGSITSLPVDCIVNAANEQLGHGAGVAAAISRAAGPHFQQESDNQVQIHGPVKVTRCIKTSAGSLNYKCVIHAVGPRFSQSTSSTDDADDLKNTVINALIMAEEEGMISVALPSISAGIFGGKPDLCADMYARGVLDFSRSSQGHHSLKEIHFVDIQKSLVKTIQSKFDIAFTLMNLDSSSKYVTNDSIGNFGETVKTKAGKTRGARTGASNRGAAETGEDAKYDKHYSSIHSHEESSYNSMYEFVGTGSLKKPHASSFRMADTEMRKETSPKRYPGQDSTENTTPSIETGNQREVYVRAKDDLTVTVKNKPIEMPSKPKTYAQATSTGNSGGELPKSPVKRDAGPSKTFDDSLQFTFPRKYGIEVSVQQADISLLNVDVVVCPESVSCMGDGSIAKSIQSVLDNKTIWDDAQKRKPQLLSAFKLPVRPPMPYKHVILVFSPRWTRATTKDKFETGLRKCIQNIFDQLKHTDTRSIALPVLGIGDETTPYQWCCEIMCDEISNAIIRHSTKLTDIVITSTYKKTVLALKDILTKELVGSAEQAGSHNTKHDTIWKRLCKACSKEMDATDPTVNTCQRCLHKSPKKQIEALPTRSFTPRGVHPYCTMSQEIVKYKLYGYDCDTIRITYEFPPGTQRAGDPYPGTPYNGYKKLAYLPHNEGGLMVFHLLKKALEKNMVFKVDKYSLVNWSGKVEHKTSLTARDRYGYPDPAYLERVIKRLSFLER